MYAWFPDEAGERIRAIIGGEDPAMAAKLLDLLAPSLEGAQALELLLRLPDPKGVLEGEFTIDGAEGPEQVGPTVSRFGALGIAAALNAQVAATQAEDISREIGLLAILLIDPKPADAIGWLEVFTGLQERLYLALCDPATAEKGGVVLLALFKLLQADVFSTFATLFKALAFAFQPTAPAERKVNAVHFLRSVAELNTTMGQAVLKLCLNFPAKTNPELDDLVAHLKKSVKK
jgi:hypothetical protein